MGSELYADKILKWREQGITDDAANPGWEPVANAEVNRTCQICGEPVVGHYAQLDVDGELSLKVHASCVAAALAELEPKAPVANKPMPDKPAAKARTEEESMALLRRQRVRQIRDRLEASPELKKAWSNLSRMMDADGNIQLTAEEARRIGLSPGDRIVWH
jgi:hypothetical protein